MYVYTCILRLLIRMIAVTVKTLKSLSRCENLLTQYCQDHSSVTCGLYTCILRLLIRMIAVTVKTLKSLSRCENLLT